MNIKIKIFLLAVFIGLNACGDWLDVVPDGIATIDMAFNSRAQAIKYLATCYSYTPHTGNMNDDPAWLGGDEIWTDIVARPTATANYNLARGQQNATAPLFDTWGSLYQGLRACNIFLENVGKVPDLPAWERDKWIAEVKVLKALYHFQLVQKYGPVPLIRENIPISADVSDVKTVREPVDECFQYIEELIDEAIGSERLPLNVTDIVSELGSITLPIAYAIKAKALVTAASPLFNGNSEQSTLRNRDGKQLFNTTFDLVKWQKAMLACKDAIKACSDAEIKLYEIPNTGFNKLNDTIATQLSLWEAYTLRYNSDIIWAYWTNQQSSVASFAPILDSQYAGNSRLKLMNCQVPLKIFDMFYTEHGVPLAEDKTRDNSKLHDLRTAVSKERNYIKAGFTTVDMHFDREPRFYAWLGFDGGIWYGAGRTDINDKTKPLWYANTRSGGVDAPRLSTWRGLGAFPKKPIPYTNVVPSMTDYSQTLYPIPVMRLSDLYLLYAEAINEAEEGPYGPNSGEMFEYINLVRKRAGLDGVKESWDTYTNSPKYETQQGMRQIIQQERMIELVFEGHRFWDIRRWKTAPAAYQTPIVGWNTAEYEDALFYQPVFVYKQSFGIRDYFWPIRNSDITQNPNLVQNIGW